MWGHHDEKNIEFFILIRIQKSFFREERKYNKQFFDLLDTKGLADEQTGKCCDDMEEIRVTP